MLVRRVNAGELSIMHRLFIAAWAACALVAFTPSVRAQSWNDPRSREVVERATTRRAQQLADTGLKDYKAVAHGYVTFLAQMGEGLAEPPKIVKADELMNEVYWLAPNLSKQRILGRRDTLLLPTDIAYHRDHLGIVQNNFPAIIRLGDGDEVVDVPHPLSAQGLTAYDFAITDSLPLNLPGRAIMLYQVKVRPKDDRQPRVIGAVYIDRDDAQVVRMALNFTRAAFRDPALEDLFVIVENGLIGGRFWLPRKQEIEIRRGGTWLDYPVRGIIRGRWEIGDYEVNTGIPRSFFAGPEIVLAPKTVQDTFHFGGRVLDSLPSDVRAVTDADIRQVQAEARALVRAQALQRPQTLMLSAVGVSDFVRYDRAEGLAFGGGLASRFGGGVGLQLRGRYGVDDHSAKGSATLEWQSPRFGVRALGFRDYRDAGDLQERSAAVNSLAAQEFGADVTDPYGVEGFGVGLDARDIAGGLRLHLDVTRERQSALTIRATPASGSFPRLIPATPLRALRFSLIAERPTALSVFGSEVRTTAELRVSRLTGDDASVPIVPTTVGRAFASVTATRPFGRNRLSLLASGGAVGASAGGIVPPQEWLYFGGPVSAPGYAFHELATLAGATTRLEWRTPIPAPAISLGRFGKVPGEATLAPFVQATFARRALATDAAHPTGVYPTAGVALQPLFDLLRIQLARGLRDGRWTFDVDIARDFWGIL
jgi:hypothetical protein